MKSVSVVIPAHNAAGCIAQALGAVAAEGDVVKEVLIVDDASTDDTRTVALRASQALSLPAKVIRADCRDAGAARNIGLAEASAPWVYLQDADDQLAKGGLRRLVECSQQVPDASLIVGAYIRSVDQVRNRRKTPGPFGPLSIDNVKRYLSCQIPSIAVGSFIVSRAVIGKAPFHPGLPYDEDTLFLLAVMARAKIATIADVVLTYSVSTQRADDRFVVAPARSFLIWSRAFRSLERCGIPRQALKVRDGIVAMKIARVHYARGDLDTAARFLTVARAAPVVKAADWWRLFRYTTKISLLRQLRRMTS